MEKKTILFTGATGALGSTLLPRLIAEGFDVVCLVRSGDGKSPKERIAAIVPLTEKIRVLQGDITEPDCGIAEEDKASLYHKIDLVLHNAASINFASEKEASSANVLGIHNVLRLTEALGIKTLFHVSTAYVAGNASRFSEQDMNVGQRWRNPYESSKFIGEVLLRSWADQNPDRRVCILRPSILIGCSDGTTPTYEGWYRYIRPFYDVATVIRKFAAKSRQLPDEISVAKDGLVNVPLVLHVSKAATLNLVPIDWVADRIIELISASGEHSKTFHLVHPQPPGAREVINTSLQILQVGGVTFVETAQEKKEIIRWQSPFTARLQKQVDAVADYYVPYVTGEPRFSMETPQQVLGADFSVPPPINRDFLERLLNYAVTTRMRYKNPKKVGEASGKVTLEDHPARGPQEFQNGKEEVQSVSMVSVREFASDEAGH